jgi:hypothetical protein
MDFSIVAPSDPPGTMILRIWTPNMSESFHINFSFAGPVVLEKNVIWPHPIFAFLKLSPLWKIPGPLFEQFWILFTYGLIIYGFTSRSRMFYLYGDVTIAGEGLLYAQGLWAGRDLYHATPVVTRGLGFSGLIRRTTSFSRLLRHTRGCGGFILTWILTGTFT